MIKKILNRISKALVSAPNGEQIYRQYVDLKSHPAWKIHEGFLVEIANGLAGLMLTRDFTELSKLEKDAIQRGIYNSKEVIDFLLDPTKGAKQHVGIIQHNQKVEATKKGSDRKGTK